MGEISEDALHGIITHMDDKYNYVWSNQLGPSELRYPINPACKFKLGEVVGYIKSFNEDRVQPGDHLMQLEPEKQRYELVRPRPESGMIKWKVKIPITFAPENSDVYRQIMANDDKQKVKAVANNLDFNLVVSFVEGLQFEVGKVYMAWITRIPRAHDSQSIARKIGTVFCIVGKTLELVTDQQLIDVIIEYCPWKQMLNSPEEDEIGVTQNTPAVQNSDIDNTAHGNGTSDNTVHGNGTSDNTVHGNGTSDNTVHGNGTSDNTVHGNGTSDNTVHDNGTDLGHSSTSHSPSDFGQQQHHIYNEEEPLADTIETMQKTVDEEEQEHLGVIVHCEPEYSAIWCPDLQLVRIQLPTPQDPDNQPVWPCCGWVKFRCIEESSPLRGDVRCNYLAYDVKKVQNGPVPVKLLGDCIAAPMRLKRAVSHSQQFFIAYDDFFGPVLCCAKDKSIVDRMDNPEVEIEVYSVYTDIYLFSKWVALFYKLEGLPPVINSLVDTIFSKHRPIPLTDEENQQSSSITNQNQPCTSQQAAKRTYNFLGTNKLSPLIPDIGTGQLAYFAGDRSRRPHLEFEIAQVGGQQQDTDDNYSGRQSSQESIEPSNSGVCHAPDHYFNYNADGADSDCNIGGTSTPPPPQPPMQRPSLLQQPSSNNFDGGRHFVQATDNFNGAAADCNIMGASTPPPPKPSTQQPSPQQQPGNSNNFGGGQHHFTQGSGGAMKILNIFGRLNSGQKGAQ